MTGDPYPKSQQLARGEKRKARKKANMAEWALIVRTKGGRCRVCDGPRDRREAMHHHHLVPRSQLGDDVADNIVPLCGYCHERIHRSHAFTQAALAASLTDAEYAYVIGKLGEGGMERLFGVGRG